MTISIVDATGKAIDLKLCPDEIVRDLHSAGYQMVTHRERERSHHTYQGHKLTYWVMSCQFTNMMTGEHLSMEDEKIYRLEIKSKGVTVVCYGLDAVDSELKLYYSSVDDLPDWAKERLAVLYLLDPAKLNQNVDKVGRRINKDVFWIYPNT